MKLNNPFAHEYVADRLIVKLKHDVNENQLNGLGKANDVLSSKTIELTGAQIWHLSGNLTVEEAIAKYSKSGLFEYVEPDYVISIDPAPLDAVANDVSSEAVATNPNDPRFSDQWGLNKIDAPEVWTVQTGNANLVIGVIDSGVDYSHPDLAGNIWTNPGEIAADGIDNDGNGYIDDIHGWDFAYSDNNPMDVNGHGTHVAGTIAGIADNGIGVTGVVWDAQIMPIKFIDDTGIGATSNAILAINYATSLGVKLTNNSWGGGGYSQALYDAIQAAQLQGALFVAAAGNGGTDGIGDNNDLIPHFPSNYNLGNIISVASTTSSDGLSSFSNYGSISVDLAAPGSNILSTYLGGSYTYLSGTSMAAPHVTGAAALLWSQYPSLTAQQVKDALMQSTDPLTALTGKVVSNGRLNIFNAFKLFNLLPTGADKTILTESAYTFNAGDFGYSDADNNAFASIRITKLPTAGVLKSNGIDVVLNQVISIADISLLTFTPALGASGIGYDSFNFIVNDGIADSATPNTISFSDINIIIGTDGDDNLLGTSWKDQISGLAGNDILKGNARTDFLDGGTGTDIAVFSGNRADYEILLNDSGQITVSDVNLSNGDESTDTLSGIELLQFSDGIFEPVIIAGGGNFKVNTYTTGTQSDPSVTGLADGGFVVVWESDGQDGSRYGVYAQRYDANGVAQGNEFRVNTYITNHQSKPSVTGLTGGGFVVSWESSLQDGNGYGIYAQHYDANGLAQGTEFRVNTRTSGDQTNPSITGLVDGGFVVSWKDIYGGGDVMMQRYDANGVPRGSNFDKYSANSNSESAITDLTGGGFVVSYSGTSGSLYSLNDIYAQRYDANGVAQGSEIRVNTYTRGPQNMPSITGLSDGGFVVSWTSENQQMLGNSIYAQRYDANGVAQGSEFLIGSGIFSSITGLDDGGFVICYKGVEIYAQRYDASGIPQGAAFRVSNDDAGIDDSYPSITAVAGGGFVVSWSRNFDIFTQRYDANGNPIPAVELLISSNHEPTLVGSLIDQAIKYGSSWNYDAGSLFNDADVIDTLSFNAILANGDPLPAWLQINATLGVLSGTPDFSDRGTYAINVTATDSRGGSVSAPMTIEVTVFDAGKLLVSTAGNDLLTGTLSNDTVTYGLATAAVTVSLATTTQQNTIGAGLDTLTAIENLIGSDFNDKLTGNTQNNILDGGAGNDTLNGGTGADTLTGGGGNDSYVVDNAGDGVTENLSEGTDKVSSKVTYILPSNVENLTLTGSSAINGTGNTQANTLTGNTGNNVLDGGAGNDKLDGKTGTNTLTGGTGKDTFKFTTAGHIDTITDFIVADDTIQLENSIFTSLTMTGILAADKFRIGTQALDANDFVIYNNTTGAIFYDADGSNAGAAVQIALVGTGLSMTNVDFAVI